MILFSTAISGLGCPLHIRTDHGGENVWMWEDKRVHRGENYVLTGSSVHNQRIEQFNRDLNINCRDVFAPIFYELESMEALDVDNESDLFSLHYVYIPRTNHTLDEFKAAFNNHSMYIPRINHTLDEFKAAFNNHSISSEGNNPSSALHTRQTSVTKLSRSCN